MISPFCFEEFEHILRAVAKNYDKFFLPKGEHYGATGNFVLEKGEFPSTIYIPLFHDFAIDDYDRKKVPIYRGISDVDEFIHPNFPADYYGFWGIEYSIYSQMVFDVKNQNLYNEEFSPSKYCFSAPGF